MRRLLIILLSFIPLFAAAEILNPVIWSGEEVGDSVRVTATFEDGWHMILISVGDEEIGEEIYENPFILTLPEAQPIRYTACNDKDCISPAVWKYGVGEDASLQDSDKSLAGDRSLLWIFILGFLGGLLAIFTPCVWPIIPMTVSFFLKKGGGRKDAILYGISIIVLYVGLGLLVTLLFGASALNDLSAFWCIST